MTNIFFFIPLPTFHYNYHIAHETRGRFCRHIYLACTQISNWQLSHLRKPRHHIRHGFAVPPSPPGEGFAKLLLHRICLLYCVIFGKSIPRQLCGGTLLNRHKISHCVIIGDRIILVNKSKLRCYDLHNVKAGDRHGRKRPRNDT